MGMVKSVLSKIYPRAETSQKTTEIFKLKMDHFEEIFDWLSLQDLVRLSQTCDSMKQIVGYYIKTHYSALEFCVEGSNIIGRMKPPILRIRDHNIKDIIKMDSLTSFLRRLVIYDYREKPVPHIKAESFKSLTEIILYCPIFTNNLISRIKEILGQLETVKLSHASFSDRNAEFYESFLQFCTRMKNLSIHSHVRG